MRYRSVCLSVLSLLAIGATLAPSAEAFKLFGWSNRFRRGNPVRNFVVDRVYYPRISRAYTDPNCEYVMADSAAGRVCRERLAYQGGRIVPLSDAQVEAQIQAARNRRRASFLQTAEPMQYSPIVMPAPAPAPTYAYTQPAQVVQPQAMPAPVVQPSYMQPAYQATGSQTAGRGIWGMFGN